MKKIITTMFKIVVCAVMTIFMLVGVLSVSAEINSNQPITKEFFTQFFIRQPNGDLFMELKNIKHLGSPVSNEDAVHKLFVLSRIDAKIAAFKTTF